MFCLPTYSGVCMTFEGEKKVDVELGHCDGGIESKS